MFGLMAGLVTVALGAILMVISSIVSFNVIPNLIESTVIANVELVNGTEQFERFEDNPFPLDFVVRLFNVSNAADVINGAVPHVVEVGPYYYKLYASREIESQSAETITYRRKEFFEFDAERSFPRTEADVVTVANIPYHALLQIVERIINPLLLPAVRSSLPDVFGSFNSPVSAFVVSDLLFDGVKLCESPAVLGSIVCSQVRRIARNIRNMEILDDGSISFSLLKYKQGALSMLYEVSTGSPDHSTLGHIQRYNGLDTLDMWPRAPGGPLAVGEDSGPCNMLNGTDAMIFNPFISREESIYAFNSDICRSIELKFVQESEYEGISLLEFATDASALNHPQGCFCLNSTVGVTGSDGCLLPGAQELQSCVGGPLVLTFPHFLHADNAYRNNILGLTPSLDKHNIILEIEPYTGSPVRASKRAQFNIFMQPAVDTPATQALRTTLTPVFWVEESLTLPEEYVDLIKRELIANLNLVAILVPLMMSVSGVVLVAGVVVLGTAWLRRRPGPDAVTIVDSNGQ